MIYHSYLLFECDFWKFFKVWMNFKVEILAEFCLKNILNVKIFLPICKDFVKNVMLCGNNGDYSFL